MTVWKSSQSYPKVFEGLQADAISPAFLVADFQSTQFSIAAAAGSDFDVQCIISNQYEAPNPALPVSANNEYEDCAYTSLDDPASYRTVANPYNPTEDGPGAVSKNFRFNQGGSRWAFIRIFNYATGTLTVCNVVLADNT